MDAPLYDMDSVLRKKKVGAVSSADDVQFATLDQCYFDEIVGTLGYASGRQLAPQ